MKALTTAEKRKNTADAAEALVAEVLMQRFGYVVLNKNVEYPNHQVYDLLVTKPGIEFFVQVKGLEKKSPWPVGRPWEDVPGLFYILTLPFLTPQRFFILKQGENNTLVEAYEIRRLQKDGSTHATDSWIGTSYEFKDAEKPQFEDQWHKLPGWNA